MGDNSMAYGPRLRRFDVYTMPVKEFFENFYKTQVKLHDQEGIFGAKFFDYFLYFNVSEEKEKGESNPYLMLFNPKSLEKMRPDIKIKIRETMKREYDIDIDNCEENQLVIMASDIIGKSGISKDSLSLYFNNQETPLHDRGR